MLLCNMGFLINSVNLNDAPDVIKNENHVIHNKKVIYSIKTCKMFRTEQKTAMAFHTYCSGSFDLTNLS